MKLISENLHIISKQTKEAIINRNEDFLRSLLEKQIRTTPDWIDLNIGPARRNFEGTMSWLTNLVQSLTDIPVSFDSTNEKEIEAGLKAANMPEKCIINSVSADKERLDIVTPLCAEFNSYLVALTLNKTTGIPKFADERLELAFSIIEETMAQGIENEKILFDPLVLPICVEQSQALESINTIRMLKESFDPQTLTTVGLSNVSNGCPSTLRSLINRVFFVLAAGCGLDSAIVDSFDEELLRINRVIETQQVEKHYDRLLLDLYELMKNFGSIQDVTYNMDSVEEVKIYKTAQILLNEKVYSHSYLEV